MTTLDERIEAARKLDGYTPGPWECFHGLQTDNWHSAVYGPAGDYDALLIAVCNQNDSHRADAVLIAAAPDLHRLALDLAAERERLLSLVQPANDLVDCWDWWTVDEYDRDRGGVSDSIEELRSALTALASEPRA